MVDLPELFVAAGVLVDDSGRVLVTQRPADKSMAGAWEFPGGKIHADETPLAGLVRELREELGIETLLARHLMRYRHIYPQQRVQLYIWRVLLWRNTPAGLEGQPLRWVAPAKLMDLGLLAADAEIVTHLLASTAVNTSPVEACLRSDGVAAANRR